MTLHKVTESGTFRTLSREDIIPLVQESIFEHPNENPFDFRLSRIEAIERFATLVAAHEREACAQVCETFYNHEAKDCAEAIRARGET